MMKMKRIDLYGVYRRKPEQTPEQKQRIRLLAPPAALLALFCVLGGLRIAQNIRLDREIAAERAYLTDDANLAQYAEYEELLARRSDADYENAELQQSVWAVESYPRVDTALIEKALDAAESGVKITSYGYADEGGALTVSGDCAGVSQAADYADALAALGCFADVGYYGYSSADGERYDFTVFCTLSGEVVG